MSDYVVRKPFKTPFLSSFILTPELLPFKEEGLVGLDEDLSEMEQVFLNPDIERSLISKNELLTSFAISKAERSMLTFEEAEEVFDTVVEKKAHGFIGKRSQKDHDKMEFFNIARTFRELNNKPFLLKNLNEDYIKKLHSNLTKGLDTFSKFLPDFTVYKSGNFRDNDEVRVGNYIPAPCEEILTGVKEIISWYLKNRSVAGVGVFHTALYGLHPFNNGNKRVCRILEYLLLKELGFNKKGLYSTSYYYHKEKKRYYKYLIYSLEKKNLNYFTAFYEEALVLSIIGVLKSIIEARRSEFVEKQRINEQSALVIKPLIKRREMQFKNLFNRLKKKMARQTFVDILNETLSAGILAKREEGRNVYYRLRADFPEENKYRDWVSFIRKRIDYIPDEFLLA